MIQIYNKIKDCPGGFHSWWQTDKGIFRKPNFAVDISASQDKGDLGGHIIETEPKVAEEIKTEIIMKNKLLLILPADSKWGRIVRRGVVIFILAGLSMVIQDVITNSGTYIGEMWVALLTAILAMLDKMQREFKVEK